jgi:hypothetical protein
MTALDGFVIRAREQNGCHHDVHGERLSDLCANVRGILGDVDATFQATSKRMHDHHTASHEQVGILQSGLSPLSQSVSNSLTDLKNKVESNSPTEYVPSGETPQKKDWKYASSLPRTDNPLNKHLNKLSGAADAKPELTSSPRKPSSPAKKIASPRKGTPNKPPGGSPNKNRVFVDQPTMVPGPTAAPAQPSSGCLEETRGNNNINASHTKNNAAAGLREVDMNLLPAPPPPSTSSLVTETGLIFAPRHHHNQHHQQPLSSLSRSTNSMPLYQQQQLHNQPPLKRHATADVSRVPRKGRENHDVRDHRHRVLRQSVGPGTGGGMAISTGTGTGVGRRLRSSPRGFVERDS